MKQVKQWDTTTPNKHEMTTELMFKEIMELRKQASTLSTHIHYLIEAAEGNENMSTLHKERIKNVKEYRKSLA